MASYTGVIILEPMMATIIVVARTIIKRYFLLSRILISILNSIL